MGRNSEESRAVNNLPKLSYADTGDAVVAIVKAARVPLVFGPPGVGKTAMAELIAKALDMELVFFVARDYLPEEFGGVYHTDKEGALQRSLDGRNPVGIACERPVLMVMDEVTAVNGVIFPQISRAVNERKFGNREVHPGTRFVLFANPQEQSLEAQDMPLPLINRLCILRLEPSHTDFQKWLMTLGETGQALNGFALELAGILDARPELLQMEPKDPEHYVSQNVGWGTPRAWEAALRYMAEGEGARQSATIQRAVLTGFLGPESADAYLGIRAIYSRLPRASQIAHDPVFSKLPTGFLEGVGVLGLLPQVSALDPAAAWVYVDRIDDKAIQNGAEIRMAGANSLMRLAHFDPDSDSPFLDQAKRARVKLGADNMRAKKKV
jgi:hypothetical protein